jgi:hypothetical protein
LERGVKGCEGLWAAWGTWSNKRLFLLVVESTGGREHRFIYFSGSEDAGVNRRSCEHTAYQVEDTRAPPSTTDPSTEISQNPTHNYPKGQRPFYPSFLPSFHHAPSPILFAGAGRLSMRQARNKSKKPPPLFPPIISSSPHDSENGNQISSKVEGGRVQSHQKQPNFPSPPLASHPTIRSVSWI